MGHQVRDPRQEYIEIADHNPIEFTFRRVPGLKQLFVDMRDGRLFSIKALSRQPHIRKGKQCWRVIVLNNDGKPVSVLCAHAVYAAATRKWPNHELKHLDKDTTNDAPWNLVETEDEPLAPKTYFILERGTDRIKIGTTTQSVEARRSNLQTGNSTPLDIFKVVDGMKYPEKVLQAKFESKKIIGEWFRLDTELKCFVESLEEVR